MHGEKFAKKKVESTFIITGKAEKQGTLLEVIMKILRYWSVEVSGTHCLFLKDGDLFSKPVYLF